ncbi:MAG: hypothetical protein DWQ04_00900 [Chloroflexi bacterium]|nr:MAG: hypothetical protein DWQ04_00900 [Chloroflexota bacterium]
MTQIEVKIDDRLRLVTAVLAASEWPDLEQKERTHAVHPHAKFTRQAMRAFTGSDAVYRLNEALLNGVSLDDLFSAALRCSWSDFTLAESLPRIVQVENWVQNLAKFVTETKIVDTFWQEHQVVWDESVNELATIFKDSPLPDFLAQLLHQPVDKTIVVMPTLVYPALHPVLATSEKSLTLVLPPPIAVGESPPWPYGEDPGWVVARTSERLLFHLLAEKLAPLTQPEQETIVRAAITLCLEQSFDEFEAQAYLLRSKKAFKLPRLPKMVETLRELLPKGGLPQKLKTLF